MAKKMSSVDAALDIARKVRVPKKPVKKKGKKTVAAVLDWGPGIPDDKLAYLNDDEMALVQAKRTFKGDREVNGIPAFPDPGDTAAGSKTSTSGGPDRGPTGGPSRSTPSSGAGAGGLGGGNKGNTGGSPGGGPSAGGSQSSQSGGQSTSPSGGAGGQKTTPSGGPGGGPLSAPARTTPSAAPSSPAGFGPRQSSTPVSTAPSSQSWQGALNRIAQGSSVVSNPTNQKQITDRIQQAAPSTVKYSQAPTVSPNMSGPGNYSSLSSLTSGANSPFADPGVTSYDAEKERDRAISTAKSISQAGILGPSVPAGTAIQKDPYFGSEQVANRYSGSMPSIGVNTNLYSSPVNISRPSTTVAQDPSLAGRAASANTLGERLVNASVAAANTIGDHAGSFFGGSPTMAAATPAGKLYTDRLPGSESIPPGDVAKTPAKQFTDQVPTYITPQMPGRTAQSAPNKYSTDYTPGEYGDYRLNNDTAQNIFGRDVNVSRNSVSAPAATAPVGMGPSVQPASAPPPSYTGNVFNKSPTQQAEDIRRAVSLAMGPAPQEQRPIDVPGYPGAQADISPYQGDYSPSQAPAYDASPSQQSGWTSAQRDAYLGSLGNSKTGQVPPPQSQQQTQAGVAPPAVPPTTLAPMPDWVDYSYLYNDYPQLAMGVNPSISAFNQYNATFRRGGRVGDSIEAALRLAGQGIVSRNKTS